jgi:hypothetical protein
VQAAEAGAEAAKKNLRTLAAEATVIVAGDWSQPLAPGGHTPLALPQEDPYVALTSADSSRRVEFFPTYVKRFNESDGTARVVFRASVRDGAWPLGQNVDSLKGFRPVAVALPMFSAGDTKTGEGTVRRLELSLFANGERIYVFADELNARAVFPGKGWRVAETNLPPIQ